MVRDWFDIIAKYLGIKRRETPDQFFAKYENWTPVTSSNVSSIAFYESPTQVSANELGVRFLNGSEYRYTSVTRQLFTAFLYSASKGKFLDQHVKKAKLPYRRVL